MGVSTLSVKEPIRPYLPQIQPGKCILGVYYPQMFPDTRLFKRYSGRRDFSLQEKKMLELSGPRGNEYHCGTQTLPRPYIWSLIIYFNISGTAKHAAGPRRRSATFLVSTLLIFFEIAEN